MKITFDRSSEKVTNLLDSIDTRLLVDRSSTDQARQIVRFEFCNFFDQSKGIFNQSKEGNFEFFLSVFNFKRARICVIRLHMISN